MNGFREDKSLVFLAIMIFLAGIFTAGFVLSTQGYEVSLLPSKGILVDTYKSAAQTAEQAIEHAVEQTVGSVALVGEDTIEKIVEKAGPAVVKLETKSKSNSRRTNPFDDPFFREFFGDSFPSNPEPQISTGLGSGFIISKDGYILTNQHVIEGAYEIDVFLTSREKPYLAKVIGADSELDLAVLKIDAGTNLPMLKLGDSNQMKVGNWVIAIGNPYGLDHTVTVGVVSAKGRPVTIDGNNYKDLIQTDASINPGNSGGPLLSLSGEVIGINTAINANAQGIGFAISSSTVSQVLEQLLTKGIVERPWLGVYIQSVTTEIADYYNLGKAEGVFINAVEEGSPADKAGLKRGDVILEFNKNPLKTVEELQQAVQETIIGTKVTLLIHREGKATAVTVTVEQKK